MTHAPIGVLITGGAGFIGSHLADRLHRRGDDVTVLDDLSTGALRNIDHLVNRDRFHFIFGSVLDRDLVTHLVETSDLVFHLAAAVGVRVIVEHPLDALLTNVVGTENVLAAAADGRVRVLVASSSEVYGNNERVPFREDDDRLLGPTNRLRWSYSTAKAVDETLAFAYHRDRGTPVVVARLFNTVGPRQTGRYGMVLPRLVAQALRGQPLTVYGDGRQSRVFTHVGDVVEALTRLMAAAGAEGEAFNVAGQGECTINQLAGRVLERTGSPSRIVHVPYADVYGEGFDDMPRRVADTSKLERTIGYRCDTPLSTVIDDVIAQQRRVLASDFHYREEVNGAFAISPGPR